MVKEPAPSVVVRKPRGWIPWVAAASTIAIIAVAVGMRFAPRPAAAPDDPLAGAHYGVFTDLPGNEPAAAISPDGKFVVFIADIDGPEDVWIGQVGSTAYRNITNGTLGRTRQAGFANGGADIWFGSVPGSPVRITQLMGGIARPFLGEKAGTPNWSPNGKKIAYMDVGESDNLVVADADGSNLKPILTAKEKGEHNHAPTWSQDGKWIYYSHGMFPERDLDLWRIPAVGGPPERLTDRGRISPSSHPAVIDARTVFYVAQDEDGLGPWLWAVDVPSRVSRRVSSGLQKYLSISASADGRHLAASVATPTSSLWSIPIVGRTVLESEVQPYRVSSPSALAPRFGGTSLFYLSSRGAGNSLWRVDNGQAVQILEESEGALFETPAVSSDGKQVAITVRKNGKQSLRVIGSDGNAVQPLTEEIDVHGSASWSRDKKWLVAGGKDSKGEEGLFLIPTDGGSPKRIAKGFATNPVWSPNEDLIVYAGLESAAALPLLAVRPADGFAFDLPPIKVPPAGERVRFLPDGKSLVYMQGSLNTQDFWLLDLTTKVPRRLTQFSSPANMRTFDITDGKIVFDRVHENSNIELIDLPKKP